MDISGFSQHAVEYFIARVCIIPYKCFIWFVRQPDQNEDSEVQKSASVKEALTGLTESLETQLQLGFFFFEIVQIIII